MDVASLTKRIQHLLLMDVASLTKRIQHLLLRDVASLTKRIQHLLLRDVASLTKRIQHLLLRDVASPNEAYAKGMRPHQEDQTSQGEQSLFVTSKVTGYMRMCAVSRLNIFRRVHAKPLRTLSESRPSLRGVAASMEDDTGWVAMQSRCS
jgi:hypothetical protein